MLLFSFTFRHLRRHWRLNLAILLGLTLAAAFLSALPALANAIAARRLHQSIEDASPASRNIQIAAPSGLLSAGLYGRVQDTLGDLIQNRVQVHEAILPADPPPPDLAESQGKTPPQTLHLWSFDKLSQSVQVLEGKLPLPPGPEESASSALPPPLEVAIGAQAATQLGWGIGDRLTLGGGLIRLDIVGIIAPLDPGDDMWWGNLVPFERTVRPKNLNEDIVKLSLILPPDSIKSYIPRHQVSWRLVLDREGITVENAPALQSTLLNLQVQLERNRVEFSTDLVQMIADYEAQLSRVRVSLFLLTAQALIFVLYTLAMISSFLVDRSQAELAALAGRGATSFQITLIFALEGLSLALLAALLLGPPAALGGLHLWSKATGTPIPSALTAESWRLALIASGFGWLAIVLPVYSAARRSLLDWQRQLTRPARRTRWQALYLDLFVLALGGLAYWQLTQSGSVLMRRLGDTQPTDPVLLLGPSLLLVAVALISLRLFPPLLRLTAWAIRRARGLMLPLGMARLARDPSGPSRVVLLISLAAGLALFANAFVESLHASQGELAHYLAGADLRISLNQPANLPTYPPAGRTNLPIYQSTNLPTHLPAISTASPVFRSVLQKGVGSGGSIHLLAIDPATFDQVARYPPSITNLTMSSLTRVLQSQPTSDALPAIFSFEALPGRDKAIGQRLTFALVGASADRVTFEVLGVISNFPTLSGRFIITSLPLLEDRVGSDFIQSPISGSNEAWLTIDPLQHAALVADPELAERILGDAQVHMRALQADVLAQGASGAFQLNALTLALLSVTGFFLVHYFTARQRTYEFGVLRAVGLSARQLLALLVTEGVLVMGLGLLAGTLIGYGLAHLMLPFLSRALATALAGTTIRQIFIDWPAVVRLYALLVGCYALAMLLLVLVLVRVGVHRTLRMGEE